MVVLQRTAPLPKTECNHPASPDGLMMVPLAFNGTVTPALQVGFLPKESVLEPVYHQVLTFITTLSVKHKRKGQLYNEQKIAKLEMAWSLQYWTIPDKTDTLSLDMHHSILGHT